MMASLQTQGILTVSTASGPLRTILDAPVPEYGFDDTIY